MTVATKSLGYTLAEQGQALLAQGDFDKKKPTSQNQMQTKVNRNQAPRDVDRVDPAHSKGGQSHVYFKDGTIHDAHKGTPNPSIEVIEWLRNNGWSTGE